jgi:hypothetical protein
MFNEHERFYQRGLLIALVDAEPEKAISEFVFRLKEEMALSDDQVAALERALREAVTGRPD